MAFGSPASQRDGSEISDTDEQDKFFGYQPVISSPYYAPSLGYNPYVMNPLLNPVCTWRNGLIAPTMPILTQPVVPNVAVPVPNYPYAAPAPSVPVVPNVGVPNVPVGVPNPGYARAPVPNPGYGRVRSDNGGGHHGGSYPAGGQGRPNTRPKSDSNNLGPKNFGDKVRV